MSSSVRTAPCVEGRRRRGWPASDSLRMLARRYHDERCQNRLAAGSASAWVASRRSFVAAHAGDERGGRAVGEDVAAVEGLGRRPHRLGPEPERLALVRGQVAGDPSPEKTVRIVTVWPSSRRLAMSPPHESATSSGAARRRRGSWPAEYTEPTGGSPGRQPAKPSAPMSGTKTHAAVGLSRQSLPCRVTIVGAADRATRRG